MTRNVATLAEPPKMSRKVRPILDGPQARALMDGTKGDRLHALWVLALTTGLRNAELLGLTWAEVDLDAPSLRVTSTLHREHGQWQMADPKTEKGWRTVPLTPRAVEALREHRRLQLEDQAKLGALGKAGLVFTTPKGQPLHGSNLPKALYAAFDRVNAERSQAELPPLPRVTVHDLRHSCATLLFAMGVPMPVVSDILGHSTTRITEDLYRHRVPELSQDAARRMQEAVG